MKIKILITTLILLALSPLAFAETNLKGFSVVDFKPSINKHQKPNWILHELKPGSTIEDSAQIKNNTEKEVNVLIYASDETKTTSGSFAVKTLEKDNTQTGKWITFENNDNKTNLTLKPNEAKTIYFKINVPEDISLKTYKGGLSAEYTDNTTTDTMLKNHYRKVIPVEIKATETPKYLPTVEEVIAEQINNQKITQTNVLAPTPYFYATIAIALLCFGYLAYTYLKERKNKKISESK